MATRLVWCMLLVGLSVQPVMAQTGNAAAPGTSLAPQASAAPSAGAGAASAAPSAGAGVTEPTASAAAGQVAPAASAAGEMRAARQSLVRVRPGIDTLPRTSGQIFKAYDITPYTRRVANTAKPEQAIVDWILRETGTEVWFSEPLGILSANSETLYVYHTPEMHQLVEQMLDRFVNPEAESHVFQLRLITIASPNWRTTAMPLLRPVNVQSPGVDAWLLSKENAAILLAELRKRTDFRDHGAPNLLVQNGQSYTISSRQPRNYVRSVFSRPQAFPGYELEMGQVEQGYTLQVSPLLSLDLGTVDAVIKCDIDQVEKFIDIPIELPTFTGSPMRVNIQVPQMASWRLHERFRWPTDQVLLLGCGVVATPSDQPSNTFLGLPNLLNGQSGRADALLLIESKGKASQTLIEPARTATGPLPNVRGRY